MPKVHPLDADYMNAIMLIEGQVRAIDMDSQGYLALELGKLPDFESEALEECAKSIYKDRQKKGNVLGTENEFSEALRSGMVAGLLIARLAYHPYMIDTQAAVYRGLFEAQSESDTTTLLYETMAQLALDGLELLGEKPREWLRGFGQHSTLPGVVMMGAGMMIKGAHTLFEQRLRRRHVLDMEETRRAVDNASMMGFDGLLNDQE